MSDPARSPPAEPPKPIVGFDDRYELLERLGQGGFALVYRARQRSTGQHVAVKVLRKNVTAPEDERREMVARFRREMSLLGQLHHPHVVRLIDAGAWEDGRLYIVTDLIEGRTLHSLIDERGALPLEEALPLMLQVLDALAAAHERGLIHRDVKPQNIMVSQGGVVPQVTLLDFGIATVSEGFRAEGYEALTTSGTLIGTPAYVAPELLTGAPASPSSDLFAWGLVFLECLTGGTVLGGRSFGSIVSALLGPKPIPLPEPLADSAVGLILAEVLEKDPQARASSAAEVYRMLERSPRAPAPARRQAPLPEPPTLPRPVASPQRVVLALAFEAVDGTDDARAAQAVREAAALLEAQGGALVAAAEDALSASFGPETKGGAARAAIHLAEQVRAAIQPEGRLLLRAAVHAGADGPDAQRRLLLTARRLESLTDDNAIWMTAPARALLGPDIAARPVGDHRLPGQADPVPVYALGP